MFGVHALTIRRFTCLATAAVGLTLSCSCEAKKPPDSVAKAPAAAKKVLICTTFYPTTYFTERIGGDLVEVVCPCPADADPAFWMPDDATIAAYQEADLIVINGAAFEKWVQKASLPPTRLVDTTAPLTDDLIILAEAITHTHGPHGQHSHAGLDGHTWLDPINAQTQAGEIKTALVKRYPDHQEAFEKGCAALVEDLQQLDQRFRSLVGQLADQQLLASHPAYNYVGRRYGWKLQNFYLDPEEMPDDETFAHIKQFIGEHPAKHMLWEAEPAPEIAARFRNELGLESVMFSPCEALGADELAAGVDFLKVMNANIDRLAKALGG